MLEYEITVSLSIRSVPLISIFKTWSSDAYTAFELIEKKTINNIKRLNILSLAPF